MPMTKRLEWFQRQLATTLARRLNIDEATARAAAEEALDYCGNHAYVDDEQEFALAPMPLPEAMRIAGLWRVGKMIGADEDDVRNALLTEVERLHDESITWAVSRWQDEVLNRPLENVHRRTLDDTWRQVIRHFGGDPETLIGPSHDMLLKREQEARAWKP